MKLVRRILVSLSVAGFLLCCATVLLFNRSEFGWQALSIPTGSMRPTMPPGSLVLVHRVPDSSLRVGDVITYTNPLTMRSTLTHRIIKMSKLDGKVPVFTTKGDANPSPDPPVVEGLVQGREVWHVSHVGEFLMLAKTWVGISVLVYIPALLIMIEETRRLADYLRRTKLYRLEGWPRRKKQQDVRPKWALAGSGVIVLVITGAGWQTAAALTGGLRSNTVALNPNMLVVAKKAAPPPSCNSNTNVSTSNSTNQTATSGSTTAQNGGSATSGSATNNNSATITITVGC